LLKIKKKQVLVTPLKNYFKTKLIIQTAQVDDFKLTCKI